MLLIINLSNGYITSLEGADLCCVDAVLGSMHLHAHDTASQLLLCMEQLVPLARIFALLTSIRSSRRRPPLEGLESHRGGVYVRVLYTIVFAPNVGLLYAADIAICCLPDLVP